MNRNSALTTLAPLLVGATIAIARPVAAGPIEYKKTFLIANVDGQAKIYAGGVVQTWEIGPIKPDKHTVFTEKTGDITLPYSHATNKTDFGLVNKGFPISDTKSVASDGWPGANPALARTTVTDANKSTATVTIDVKARQADPKKIEAVGHPDGNAAEREIKNYVEAVISGSAKAGEKWYTTSADSAGAVYVEGGDIFQGLTGIKQYTYYGKNQTLMGSSWQGNIGGEKDPGKKNPGQGDPWFVTFTDLETGDEITEAIANQSLEFFDADVSIDDTGIFLAINPLDLDSFVDFFFSSLFPWVANPFQYGFHFDAHGLSVFGGKLNQSAWSLNTTAANRWEAFMPWASGSQPYDEVTITVPGAFNVEGHQYSMSAGIDDVAWDTNAGQPVPEPGTAFLVGAGLLCARRFLRNKRSCQPRIAGEPSR